MNFNDPPARIMLGYYDETSQKYIVGLSKHPTLALNEIIANVLATNMSNVHYWLGHAAEDRSEFGSLDEVAMWHWPECQVRFLFIYGQWIFKLENTKPYALG